MDGSVVIAHPASHVVLRWSGVLAVVLVAGLLWRLRPGEPAMPRSPTSVQLRWWCGGIARLAHRGNGRNRIPVAAARGRLRVAGRSPTRHPTTR